ncbi:MerR family transcriptional regulator [Kitasatospora sp. NBC_00085]
MNGDTLCSIGDLARRTALTVKTVRFYSDQGLVVPAGVEPDSPQAGRWPRRSS